MSRAAALGTLVQRTGWGRRAVQRFVAGNTIEEAVAVALDAKRRGFTVTLDRLGEASTGAAADLGSDGERRRTLAAVGSAVGSTVSGDGEPVNEGKLSDHMRWLASVLYKHARV